MFEMFIALRYLKSKRKINLISVISILSTIGITIGVAALVIVLSVFNGFGGIVTSILMNFDPNVRVTFTEEKHNDVYEKLLADLSGEEEIDTYYSFVAGKAILFTGKKYEIVELRGLDIPNDRKWGVTDLLLGGSSKLDGDDIAPLIIGFPQRLKLSKSVGDTITVSSFYNIEKTVFSLALPVNRKAVIGGVYKSNNKDYDNNLVFTSLQTGQSILGFGSRVSGIDIKLKDADFSEEYKESLEKKYGSSGIKVETWFDLHRDLYSVMLIERWAAYIILCLIIAVGTFNILGSLTMTVVEKRKDIAILRTMGANEKSILRIFMFEGMLIGLLGTIIGMAIGLLVCWLQIEYNIYPLDPSKYIIDYLPLQVKLSDILAISGMAFFLSFLSALYPARRAVKLGITDSLKWE